MPWWWRHSDHPTQRMNQPPEGDRSLTRAQFDEVIRRASELALEQGEPGSGDSVSEADLYRIASEVGLSDQHVRRALSEVRTARVPDAETWLDHVYGPETVRAGRVLNDTAADLVDALDEYMVGGRLLQRVRKSSNMLQYRPAVDWMSQVARAASGTARRYYVASAKEVEVHLDPVDETRVHVELRVDPGIRGGYVGGGITGGLAAGAAGGTGILLLTEVMLNAPDPVTYGAVAGVFGLLVGVVGRATAQAHRRKYEEVRSELEGVLDQLEAGEPLSPPPASWRKWIERRFHGARRLLDPADDGDRDGPPARPSSNEPPHENGNQGVTR